MLSLLAAHHQLMAAIMSLIRAVAVLMVVIAIFAPLEYFFGRRPQYPRPHA